MQKIILKSRISKDMGTTVLIRQQGKNEERRRQ
jgi:hypothetical protein